MFIWYIFSSFGIMYPEKSGNPGPAWQKSEKTLRKTREFCFCKSYTKPQTLLWIARNLPMLSIILV
jgi:hypothetical protein